MDRLNGDLDKVNELYEFAEQLYSYKNLREPTFVSPSPLTALPIDQ